MSDTKKQENESNEEQVAVKGGLKAKLAKLKQKKFWVPLLVGHLLMFSGMGAFVYMEEEHKKTIEYSVEILNESIMMNDPNLFATVFSSEKFITNTYTNIEQQFGSLKDLHRLVGDLPSQKEFSDGLSKLILNVVRNQTLGTAYDRALDLLPPNLTDQIHTGSFNVNKSLSNPQKNSYIVEHALTTIKWGNFPLQLQFQSSDNRWKIVKIHNLNAILKIYNDELVRLRQKQEKYHATQHENIKASIDSYITNPVCVAGISTIQGKNVLTVRIDAENNTSKENIISWGAYATIYLEDGSVFHKDYYKVNKLFMPGDDLAHTWNAELEGKLENWNSTTPLRCETEVTYVNLPDGVFYETNKSTQ